MSAWHCVQVSTLARCALWQSVQACWPCCQECGLRILMDGVVGFDLGHGGQVLARHVMAVLVQAELVALDAARLGQLVGAALGQHAVGVAIGGHQRVVAADPLHALVDLLSLMTG